MAALDVADRRTVLLSVRPRHAEAILDGRKTVEVRRQPVRIEPGSPLVIYATSPTRAIVGLASVESTVRVSAEQGWDVHHAAMAIGRDELDRYLDGKPGSFLRLGQVTRLETPLPLDDLRNGHPFRPPRSYRFVSADDPAPVRNLASRVRPTS